jgi:uncharacterized damage-inducible protein DinB
MLRREDPARIQGKGKTIMIFPEKHALLQDLLSHQEWADAEHWRAMEAHQAALDDRVVRERLYHIHLVQHAFLSIIRGEKAVLPKFEDFANPAALKEYARQYHRELTAFMDSITTERLDAMLVIPWFKDPPIEITVAQALTQVAMHSHSHRGQNATRFREIGGQPPTTDVLSGGGRGVQPRNGNKHAPLRMTGSSKFCSGPPNRKTVAPIQHYDTLDSENWRLKTQGSQHLNQDRTRTTKYHEHIPRI